MRTIRKFKKNFKRYRKYRKPSRLKYARGAVRPTYRAKRIFKMLGSIAEKKVAIFEGSGGGYTVGTAGFVAGNPQIFQGAGRAQRVGNKIFLRYVIFRGLFFANNTSISEYRVSLVWPKDKTYAAVGDMPTTSLIQPWDLDKFTVLWDKIFVIGNPLNPTVNAYQNNTGIATTRPFTYKVPVFKSMSFDDTVTTPNSTWPILFMWANDSVLPSPIVYYNTTWCFSDV